MNLLGSLLPGLRDLRTPLAAGYLWLLALWLAVGRFESVRSTAGQINTTFDPIIALVGPFGLLGVITLCAYILGSMAVLRVDSLRRTWFGMILASLSRPGKYRIPGRGIPHASDEIRRALSYYRMRSEDLMRASDFTAPEGKSGWDPVYLRGIIDLTFLYFDPQSAAIRLHINSQSLWEDYDRKLSESEFRLSLTIPFIAVGVVGSLVFDIWFLAPISIAMGALLWRAADLKAQDAFGVLIQAVVAGAIEDPWIARNSRTYDSDEENDLL